MIKHYTDHAANERTFLAWVRTAIAVMAFGFLIERFDIFLVTMASGAQSRPLRLHGQKFANEVGLAFILLGMAMIAVAALRFFRIAKEIDKDEAVPSSGSLFRSRARGASSAARSVFVSLFVQRGTAVALIWKIIRANASRRSVSLKTASQLHPHLGRR
jgi:putative membrane protein